MQRQSSLFTPLLRRLSLGLLSALILLSVSACGGAQGAGSPAASTGPVQAACPPAGAKPSGTYTASGDQFSGAGLDVTAVASLDPNYGVNGTIDILVTVNCPAGITDVSAWQSYEAWGSTVSAHLSEISHSGDTWEFALFADNLSGSHPFEVGLYQHVLSGSGQPPLAVIVFKWPANLVKHMAE
jgi:hypothetical protein